MGLNRVVEQLNKPKAQAVFENRIQVMNDSNDGDSETRSSVMVRVLVGIAIVCLVLAMVMTYLAAKKMSAITELERQISSSHAGGRERAPQGQDLDKVSAPHPADVRTNAFAKIGKNGERVAEAGYGGIANNGFLVINYGTVAAPSAAAIQNDPFAGVSAEPLPDPGPGGSSMVPDVELIPGRYQEYRMPPGCVPSSYPVSGDCSRVQIYYDRHLWSPGQPCPNGYRTIGYKTCGTGPAHIQICLRGQAQGGHGRR
jgi:hypothetical protein